MKQRFNSDNIIHRQALYHMVGQSEQMNMAVTTAHVSAWLGCHKQTARKHLGWLARNGQLIMTECEYRNSAKIAYWQLTESDRAEYERGAYAGAYALFVHIFYKHLRVVWA